MFKVFLGGTCNESIWREILIDMLEAEGVALESAQRTAKEIFSWEKRQN